MTDSAFSGHEDKQYFSLTELCNELSISVATGRNWIKRGKISPVLFKNKSPYFSSDYVNKLKSELKSGKNNSLKSRRNKKYITGNRLYNSYISSDSSNLSSIADLLSIIEDKKLELTEAGISCLIADCAKKLFLDKYNGNSHSFYNFKRLIDDLIDDMDFALEFERENPELFTLNYTYEPSVDILGLLYISCNNLGKRKATGSYYTPTKVVTKLISKLDIKQNDKLLDPCCGTGNFLLQLPSGISFENVYGNDLDETAVKITRLNMALCFPDATIDDIVEHISNLNYLTEYEKKDFNYIIGNPPWGYVFSENEKNELKQHFSTADGSNIESYDLFIERAVSQLATDGNIAFVLPEALLNVKKHFAVRQLILENTRIHYLEYLGNIFDNVQCPSIILQLTRVEGRFCTTGMTVNDGSRCYVINTERNVCASSFNFLTTDAEYAILEKIKSNPSNVYLKNNADFAMGIVTGNNERFIAKTKSPDNEIILKGLDISKYAIHPSGSYVTYTPELFQQTALDKLYRAPEKLLYRFICNRLVFAYDNNQTLCLNSCNIVIPRIAGLQMKYIMAILNSTLAQFFFIKEFNSMKVLKSHLECIPIPVPSQCTQNKIVGLVDSLISGVPHDAADALLDEIDRIIYDCYDLSPGEQEIIKNPS